MVIPVCLRQSSKPLMASSSRMSRDIKFAESAFTAITGYSTEKLWARIRASGSRTPLRDILPRSLEYSSLGAPRYGDMFRPQPKMIEENMSLDSSLLKLLEQCRAKDFIDSINRDENSRKICGVAPLYTMAKAFEGRAQGKHP